MIEHRPWIGQDYETGLFGKKVLIFGYSHYGSPDHVGFTEDVVKSWAAGEENTPFCPRIRSYFSNDDPASFWHSVAFANTLPNCVGDEDARYSDGTPEQIASVESRVLQIIRDLTPDRIFVFSRKAWKIWPKYTGKIANGTLRVPDVGEFDAGSYAHPAGEAMAFGFAHPQYASVGPTSVAVQKALSAEPSDIVAEEEGTTVPDAPPAQ